MTEVFEFIIFLTLAITVISVTVFLMRRLRVLLSLIGLRKIEGVTVSIRSPLSLISPWVSKKPLASLTVRDKIFDIHLFSGVGRSRFVHIANEKYAVVYSKLGGIAPKKTSKSLFLRQRAVAVMPSGVASAKTRIIPKPDTGAGHIPILLFSPEPSELTYVTPERTSIKVAFTGERVGEWLIFTKDTLKRYIDRESRGFFDGIKERSE